MARAVRVFSRFQRSTGHEHPNLRVVMENYRQLLTVQKLAEPEIAARIKAASEGADKLSPIVPEVERLLGPAKPVADVLSALDRSTRSRASRPSISSGRRNRSPRTSTNCSGRLGTDWLRRESPPSAGVPMPTRSCSTRPRWSSWPTSPRRSPVKLGPA